MSSEMLHKLKQLSSKSDLSECSQANEKQRKPKKNENDKYFVPGTVPTDVPAIWSESEFKRIQKLAHRMTEEEKIQLKKQKEKAELQIKNECNERLKLLAKAKLEQASKPGTKLFGEEAEATNRSRYIIQRAIELRQEQEDKVKRANSVILAAKCLSIREAQILERKLINREMKDHDSKLDVMMEEERQKALKVEDDLKQKRREIDLKHVVEVAQQIRDNEIQRDVEFEHKQEEGRSIRKALIAMQREELKNSYEKRMRQQKAREDFCKTNEAIARFKIIENEEKRKADLKIQEFMRRKAEREAAREAQLEKIKQEKNLEIVRLQAQQQRSMDFQAMNDELRAQRVQEECERAWREKERANVLKRKSALESLLKAREKQVEDIRKTQALEMKQEKDESDRIAAVQKELYEIEVEKRRKRKEAAMKHCKELLRQINDKELKRMEIQKQKFEESHISIMEKEERDLNIENAVRKKIERLRESNVPEYVIKDVQRQLKLEQL